MTFPDTSLDLRIELAFGARLCDNPASWTWTDVTTDRLWQEITPQRGRPDETASSDPMAVSFELDNTSGDYTPNDPRSQYWPHVVRGTPCRISVVIATVTHVRFIGEVTRWAPHWPYGDTLNSDGVAEARVTVEAEGLLRRLGRTDQPLDSALTRYVTALAAEEPSRILAYWPMEDEGPFISTTRMLGAAPGSSFARSPMESQGVQPMHIGGAVNFGSDDTLPASASLMSVSQGEPFGWNAFVPRDSRPDYQIDLFFRFPEAEPGWALAGLGTALMVVTTTGTIGALAVYIGNPLGSPAMVVDIRNKNGGSLDGGSAALTSPEFFGRWCRCSAKLSQAGGSVAWRVDVFPIQEGPLTDWTVIAVDSGTFSGSVGQVSSVVNYTHAPPESSISFGHLIVSDYEHSDSLLQGAETAWTKETATRRIWRLCGEEGIPVAIQGDANVEANGYPGDAALSEPLGPQPQKALLDLLDDGAMADGGILVEQRDALAILYRTRQTLINQSPALVLDASSDEIASPFLPTFDDQSIINAATVKRPEGASRLYDASMSPADRYHKEFERNLPWDRDLRRHAAWLVALGSWPGMRYPTVTVDLAAAPQRLDDWLGLDVGDRVQVTNLPSQHPLSTVDLLVQGYAEPIRPRRWTPELNASPAGPYTAGVLDYPGPDPTRISTFIAGTTDGNIESTSATYSIARAGTGTLSTITSQPTLLVGQFLSGTFSVYESFLSFDTSSIPDSDTILSVALELQLDLDSSVTDFTMVVADRDWGVLLTNSDFVAGASLGALTSAGSIATSGIGSTGEYKTITLTPANLTNLGTGNVRLILFSSRHRDNNTPSGDEFIRWLSANSGSPPRLVVTHTPDPNPDPDPDPDLSLARLDTDGSSLAAAINDTATALAVSVDKGPPWDSSGNYVPLGVLLGDSEEVSVTAIGAPSSAEGIVGAASAATSASTSHVAPSVLSSGTSERLVCAWLSHSAAGNYTVPGGMTPRTELDGSTSTFRSAEQAIGSTGATGTRTATFSSSNAWAAASAILHGAASAPTLEASDQATATDIIELNVTAEENWWLVATHAWNTGFFFGMSKPSGPDWMLLADSGVPADNKPQVKVWVYRVTAMDAGVIPVTFGFTSILADDNFARLEAWSGVHGATQAFTVVRNQNGLGRAHPAGASVRAANPFRLRL